jgi:lysophospholipase L1-like esterase
MRRWLGRFICAAPIIAALAGTPALAEPQIVWRVENPFRFFLDPADTAVHRATWESLSPEQRATPVLSAERLLQARHPEAGWSATMYDKTCWDAKRTRYECPDLADYLSPRAHTVRATLKDLPDAATVDCTWLTAPKGRGGRGKAVTLPCDLPVQLEIPYPDGAWVKVEIGGRQVAEVMARVTDLFIVGMGDSFASGEGNPDVPVQLSPTRTVDYDAGNKKSKLQGYPARIGDWKAIGDLAFIEENARWQEQACHRSLYSHQLRAALQIAVEDPHRAVTFVGVACSGAETTFGLFLRYKGHEWVPNPPRLSQISAIAEAQCANKDARDHELPEAYHMNEKIPELKGGLVLRKCDADRARRIDLLFLSIGGNDIGFSRLVANAVLADHSMLRKLGGWFGQVHGFKEAGKLLDVLDDRLKAVNRATHFLLHVPWSESDRVILTGYPPLALLGDGSSICPDGNTGMTVLPDFFLSEAKAREGNTTAERLHAVMEDSARQHGWTLIDTHRAAFRGRGICAGHTEASWGMADDMRLPRLIDGMWEPYNPAEWRAYATRHRWFRTPNDAFMTGNFHVSESLLQKILKTQKLAWMQPLLASLYSGAFHPTAEGQAAIADALVERSRTILAKYEARRRPDLDRVLDGGLDLGK